MFLGERGKVGRDKEPEEENDIQNSSYSSVVFSSKPRILNLTNAKKQAKKLPDA